MHDLVLFRGMRNFLAGPSHLFEQRICVELISQVRGHSQRMCVCDYNVFKEIAVQGQQQMNSGHIKWTCDLIRTTIDTYSVHSNLISD